MLNKELKIYSIIPARSGSKGLSNKNIKNLGGKPLLAWSIAASKKSKYISRTFVDTDSKEYANLALTYGAEVPFLRPAEISQDGSTDYEFVTHFLNYLEEDDYLPDVLVHLRPTTPFRDPIKIDLAIEIAIKAGEEFSALRSVHEMSETSFKTMGLDENDVLHGAFTKNYDLELLNAPRQSFAKTFSANGYVDILFPKIIKNNKQLHGSKVRGFLTEQVIEIDSQFDFMLCELILENQIFSEKSIWS
jgi:CMP-N-acetylneuraminic acid synthetase